MLDGLYPFTLAFANGTFWRSEKYGAEIFVLDIGLYLIPLLRTVFPDLSFRPFHSIDDLPRHYESVDVYGLGFPEGDNDNPFQIMSGKAHPSVIRDVILTNLNIESRAECIVQISRQLLPGNLEAFHARAALDASREAPGLRDFHDVGGPVYTAMHYYASTAQERRSIKNEQAVFRELVRVFNKKRGICVKLVQLDKLSIAEQFEVYATAKVVLGQHGAGLAYTAVMPNGTRDGGTLIEFDPNYNKNFYYTATAVGVAYIHADSAKYAGIYNTADNTFVDLNTRQVARLVGSLLSDWDPPETALKGVIYNGTAADPSPQAVLESAQAADIAFGKSQSSKP